MMLPIVNMWLLYGEHVTLSQQRLKRSETKLKIKICFQSVAKGSFDYLEDRLKSQCDLTSFCLFLSLTLLKDKTVCG